MFGAQARNRYVIGNAQPRSLPVIGLSVAVGRFVEALFWAILRVAGVAALGVVLAAVAIGLALVIARRLWKRRNPKP